MKNKMIVLAVALAFALGFAGPISAQSKFGFKFGGGLASIAGGDINAGLQGTTDLYGEIFGADPHIKLLGDYEAFHLGTRIDGELFYQITPEIAFGLGVGYLAVSRESSITVTDGSDSTVIYWKPRASVVPVTLNFHYYVPVSGRVKLVLTAGAGLYITKFDLDQRVGSETVLTESSASGFGAHGGLGLEIGLSRNLSVTVDLLGRYARVGGLTGTRTNAGGKVTDGKFWYFEAEVEDFGSFPFVVLDEGVPSGMGAVVENVREARLDLSGFGVVIGFLFRI